MKRLAFSLRILSSIALAVVAIAVRFQSPHLTETELFLRLVQNYWWAFAQFVVIQIVTVLIVKVPA